MSFEENGSASVFKIDQQNGDGEERKASNMLSELNSQRRIQKSDLPKKVTMPPNFFEKQKNIWADQSLYK